MPTLIRGVLAPFLLAIAGLAMAGAATAAATQNSGTLWETLKQPGHFVLMRHALAPGTGDPGNFQLDDCGTQRNLSDGGRQQARRTGEAFRENGITDVAVYSSLWCRCLETARLLGFGDTTPLPSLNSFFQERSEGPAQTRQLQEDVRGMDLSRTVILVTHQVNVTAFSGVNPRSGEMVVMRRTTDYRFETVGSIDPLSAMAARPTE